MINIHLYPSTFENESRIEKQARSLAGTGRFAEIWLLGTRRKGLRGHRSLDGSIAVRLLGLENRVRSLVGKLLIFIIFYVHSINFCRGRDIGCVNAHSLSVLPLAVIIKTLHGAKLIYDTHELETETNGVQGLRKRLAKFVEKSLIRKADQVFVVSESIADWYQNSYSIPRPVVVLNAPRLIPPPVNDYFRQELGIDAKQIIVLYQGSLGHGRGVELLLNSFEQRSDSQAVIVFMGYGALEDRVREVAAQCQRVFFRPAVPPADVLGYTASADIGISFIENTCLSYFYCLPNKLFEYSMVGLPVIVSDMKEMREAVNRHQIGLVVESQSIDAVNRAIDTLLEMDLSALKKNARKFAEQHAWESQEKTMLEAYNRIGLGAVK